MQFLVVPAYRLARVGDALTFPEKADARKNLFVEANQPDLACPVLPPKTIRFSHRANHL
jgi:hypothetical protein